MNAPSGGRMVVEFRLDPLGPRQNPVRTRSEPQTRRVLRLRFPFLTEQQQEPCPSSASVTSDEREGRFQSNLPVEPEKRTWMKDIVFFKIKASYDETFFFHYYKHKFC